MLILLKAILRGYLRNATFSIFNLVSITLVLVVVSLGVGYLTFEHSYESNHEKAASLYRVIFNYRAQAYGIVGFPAQTNSDSNNQLNYVNAIRESAAVRSACQFITQPYTEYIQTKNKRIPHDGLLLTNTPTDFISMFTWKPTLGSLDDFAVGANRVLLTDAVAIKLFGEDYRSRANLIGSDVLISGTNYILSAIIEDVSSNSHFDFSIALSTDRLNYWGSRLYVEKEKAIGDEQLQVEINRAIALVDPRLVSDELYQGHSIQKITEIHLGTPALYDLKEPGNQQYIFLVTIFIIFIFVLGAFNYSNINMAIYSKNEKSFGIKRVVGASSKQVAIQLWLNGLVLAFLSLIPAVAVLSLVIPGFNQLMSVQLAYNPFQDIKVVGVLLFFAVAIGSFASLGPIWMVSRKPVLDFFKNRNLIPVKWHMPLRNQLITSQFIIMIIISSLCYVVLQQLSFVSSKDVGYQTENILYAYTSEANTTAFQEELRAMPGIAHVGNGSAFGTQSFNTLTYKLEGTDEVFDDSRQLYVDVDALKAYKIKTNLAQLPEGRFTLINRTAAEKLARVKGVTVQDLTGAVIITEPEYVNPETGQAGIPFTIAGIFEDIHLFSLHEKVEPYFLIVAPTLRMDGRTIIALDGELTSSVTDKIQQAYTKLGEEFPLQLDLLQNNVDQLYKQDRQFGSLLTYLNIIALIISGIGFMAITIFTLRTKVKEIGIRKVLGASAIDLISLMSKGYMSLIIIALIISWPLAYYLAQTWLQGFAYSISLSQLIFPLVGLFTLVFTLTLIIAITNSAAQANPVDSIRNE